MNSFAHYSFGVVSQWMFQTMAGIDTPEPGFQHLVIKPQPGQGIDWVKAGYDSIHGRIVSKWRKHDGKLFVDITVPANCDAVIGMPALLTIPIFPRMK